MSASPGGRIGEQHAAYRKGLVLGLTMAEVGILIVFILLLLIAYEFVRREGTVAVEAARYRELERAETVLHEIGEVFELTAPAVPDDFVRLVRAVEAAAQSPSGQTALAEAKAVLEEMQRAVDRVTVAAEKLETGTGDAVGEKVKSLGYRIENQEGLLRRYEAQLASLGQGTGGRPCWVRETTGEIDYLYDVVLRSHGISLREYVYPERSGERALLPMPAVDAAEVLAPAEFLRRTAPLYAHAKKENCVFFVVVYDATAPHEKARYQSLLRTVESHFYKLLRENVAAPF